MAARPDERRAAEPSVQGNESSADQPKESESPADQPDEQELPAVAGEPPTVDNLANIWLVDGSPTGQWGALLVRFGADGTVAFGNGGWVDTEPAVLGTYEIEGNVITFTGGPESLEECVGDSWAWQGGSTQATRPTPRPLHRTGSQRTALARMTRANLTR